MAEAVFFDLDGTLVDTAPDFHTVLNAMLAEAGKPALPYEKVRSQLSNGARAVVQTGFGGAPGRSGPWAGPARDLADVFVFPVLASGRLSRPRGHGGAAELDAVGYSYEPALAEVGTAHQGSPSSTTATAAASSVSSGAQR